MELQRILAMGVATQSLGCNIDRLHELVNQHKTLHKFPGHADIWNDEYYHIQTLVDNVCLPNPELLVKVNQLIVESVQSVTRTKYDTPFSRAL